MNLQQILLKNIEPILKASEELQVIQDELHTDYLKETNFLISYATLPCISEFVNNTGLNSLYRSHGTPVVSRLMRELSLFKQIPFEHWEAARSAMITALLIRLKTKATLEDLVNTMLKCVSFTQEYSDIELTTIKTQLTQLVEHLLVAFQIYELIDDVLITTDLGKRVISHLIEAHSLTLFFKNEMTNATKT